MPFGARWRLADRVEGPASAWGAPAFDDRAWAEGPAPIGYGEGDELTLLPNALGPGDDDRVTAVRHVFELDDPTAIEGLRFRLVHDDGAVVFLNGVELFRSNVRSLPLSPELPAVMPLHAGAERRALEFRASAEALRPGRNVVAALVHQHWGERDDLRFDLELAAVTAAVPTRLLRGPWLQSASPRGVVVGWRTNRAVPGAVRYRPLPDGPEREAGGEAASDHELALSGLAPDTRYAYAVLDGEATLVEGEFRTAPPTGSQGPVRIWALGDSGTGDDGARAVRDGYLAFAGDRPADVWILLGDNAYPTGSDGDHQHALFEMYPAILRTTPVWPVLGNHGANLTDTRERKGPFYDIWATPTAGEAGGPPSGNEAFYAFDHGNVRLVAIDSSGSAFSPRAPMMRWLPEALRAPEADWVIAYLHNPGLSGGTHELDPKTRTFAFWSTLVPYLEAADVDLLIAGHSHAYERSRLLGPSGGLLARLGERVLDAGDGDPDGDGAYRKTDVGTIWVVAGSGGQVGREGDLVHPAMAVSLRELGSLVLDVEGCRLEGRFVAPGGSVRDRFALDKCAARESSADG